MCIKFLNKFYQRLDEKGTDLSDVDQVEAQLMKFCKGSKDKEERFVSIITCECICEMFMYFPQCYYIGGLSTSATRLLNVITKPIGYRLPAEKLCEKLKKQDKQICDLQYG